MRSKRRYEIWTGVKGDDKHGGIYLYKYEADENKLLLVRQEVRLRGFTHIAMSSDKNTLLVTGKTDTDQDVLQSYRIADQNGSLRFMNETVLHTAGDVCHLSISPDKKIIAVTDFADGAVHFYEMDKEGKIGAFIQRLEFKGSSVSYRQDRAHPHSAFFTADSKYCYVADFGSDKVWILEHKNNEKTFDITGSWSAPAGSGPRHIAFHEKNGYTYTIMEMSAQIAAWKATKRAETEELQIINIANHELPGNFGEVGEDGLPQHYMAAGDIAISKTGEFIAASVRGHYEIVILRVLPDGRMELASRLPVRGAVRTIRFNKEGDILFTLGERMGHSTGIMEIFKRKEDDPALFKSVNQIDILDAFVCSIKELA